MTTLNNAIAQMRADGMPDFPPGHPQVGLGKITRYGPKKTAWYILNEFRTKGGTFVVVGAYGCWGKIESTKIEVDWKDISVEERAELQAQQRAAEAREREVRAERAHHAANRAKQQWDAAGPVPDDSPYLVHKRVDAEGVRAFTDGTLAVPMLAWDRERDAARVVGLQKIMPDGMKRFTKNMAKEGAFCRLGTVPQPGQTILVCEGLATGLSIRMATAKSHPVIVAFDAGNLLPVVALLRERYAGSAIVICADDDWKTTRHDGTPWNPGTDYASRAAIAHKAWLVVPVFPVAAARGDKWTDFNDLHVECGLDFVTLQINDAIAAAEASMRPDSESISTPGTVGTNSAVDGIDLPPAPPLEAYGADAEPKGKKQRKRPGPAPDAQAWEYGVQYGRDGPKASVHNAYLYLMNHDDWRGVLGFDLFAEQVVKLRPPPWSGGKVGEWVDLDDHELLLWLSTRIGEPSNDALQKAVVLAARKNEFNPLMDRLNGLVWDQIPRLQTWLIDWCHVMISHKAMAMDDQQLDRLRKYAEIIGPRWMVGAVARVYEPGCQMDTMLILESEGGFRKSTLFRTLGGVWFTDARLNFQDKDSQMILQGKHIIEMAELEGMNKADASETKRFLTHREDLFRPPYGRRLVKLPRRCVFAGTVNLDVYLKDDTGNRRFWPIQTGGPVDIEAFKLIVDQLWAEAVHWYRLLKAGDQGMRYWIEPSERALVEEQQEDRFEQDAWETRIRQFLDASGFYTGDASVLRCDEVTLDRIMGKCLLLDVSKRDPMVSRRLGKIMKRLGWYRRRNTSGDRGYYYVRPDEDGLPPAKKAQNEDTSGAGAANTFDGVEDDIPL